MKTFHLKKQSNHRRKELQSFLGGEEDGFDYLFRRYNSTLCFFANQFVKNLPEAEDIVSDVFIKIWEGRESFGHVEDMQSYLYKSVRNACLRWREKRRAEAGNLKAAAGSPINEMSVEEGMIRTEVMRELHESIELLPTECKRIFTQLYLEGKTVKEIAEELKLSVSTVKTQKARALAFLRGKLSPLGLLMLLTATAG